MARVVAFLALLCAVTTVSGRAHAQDPDVKAAREAFLKGAKLVRDTQWAEALAAFEESSKARAHAMTTFNIGACHRAMGQYTLARRDFERALAENEKSSKADLSPALADETRRAADEMTKLQAQLELELKPASVQITVDGRPLEAQGAGEAAVFLAGTLPAGPGAVAPSGRFRVLLDPGVHVITLSRRGFADAVRRESFAPGDHREIKLELDRLPATIRVASAPEGGQVLVDDTDVGLAPLSLARPAGKYHVVVKKKGFVPFETETVLDPGQSVDVTAKLPEEKVALTKRWWFWTGAAVVLAGAAVTTYLVTRPAPERPAVDGGGLNWAARAP